MQYLRRLIKFFILLFILSILSIRIFAIEYNIPEKQENKYVYDVENQISTGTMEKINKWCKELDEKSNIQIYIITFNDILNPNAMKAYMIADQINQEMKEDGKEVITIFVSKEKNKIIVDYSSGIELNSLYYVKLFHKNLEESDYSGAIRSTVYTLVKQMASIQEIEIDGVYKIQNAEQIKYNDDTYKRILIIGTVIFLSSLCIIAISTVAMEEFIANRKW